MFEGERQPFHPAAENPGRLASSPFPSFLPSRRDLWMQDLQEVSGGAARITRYASAHCLFVELTSALH